MQKKLRTAQKIFLGILVAAILLVGAFLLYVSDYYHAAVDLQERAMFSDIRVLDTNDALIVDPGNTKTALVFYPGGKVDHRAYEPVGASYCSGRHPVHCTEDAVQLGSIRHQSGRTIPCVPF